MGSIISKLFGSGNEQNDKNNNSSNDNPTTQTDKTKNETTQNDKTKNEQNNKTNNTNNDNLTTQNKQINDSSNKTNTLTPEQIQNQKLEELFKSVPTNLNDFINFFKQYESIGRTEKYDLIFKTEFEKYYLPNLASALEQITEIYNQSINLTDIKTIESNIASIEKLKKDNYELFAGMYFGNKDTTEFNDLVGKQIQSLQDRIKQLNRNIWLYQTAIPSFIGEIIYGRHGYNENPNDNKVSNLNTMVYDSENNNYMPLDMYKSLLVFPELLPLLYTEKSENDYKEFLKLGGELEERIIRLKQCYLTYYGDNDSSQPTTEGNKTKENESIIIDEGLKDMNESNYKTKIKESFKKLKVMKIKMIPYLATISYENYDFIPDVYPICSPEIEKFVAVLMITNRIINIVNMKLANNATVMGIKYFKINDSWFDYDKQYPNTFWDLQTKISVKDCQTKANEIYEFNKKILEEPVFSSSDEYKIYIDRLFYNTFDNDINLHSSKLLNANESLFDLLKINLDKFNLKGETKTKIMYVYNAIDYLTYGRNKYPPIPKSVMTDLILAKSSYDYVIPVNNSNEQNDINTFDDTLLNYCIGNKCNVKNKLHLN